MPSAPVRRRTVLLTLLLSACGGSPDGGDQDPATALQTPQQVADELLAADRAFARAATDTDLVSAYEAMFAPDVLMPNRVSHFASGIAEARAALESDTLNARSTTTWGPVRAGVSADGLHGFTFGYMTVMRPDATTLRLKYLSYWVKGADGWRVAAFKRGSRGDGEADESPMAPSLPPTIVPPTTDASVVAEHRASLEAAEQAFSDEAQVIGLGPAFAKHGASDAVNMGGPAPAWVVGADAIGAIVGDDRPSPLSWSADRAVLVASSGDLGVTFGSIHGNEPGVAPPQGFPFFTIWRRGPGQPWRYVAE